MCLLKSRAMQRYNNFFPETISVSNTRFRSSSTQQPTNRTDENIAILLDA